MKALAVTVALGGVGAGAGLLAPRAPAPGVAEAHAEAPPVEVRPDPEPPKRDEERTPEARLERLLHEWARASDAAREARYTFKRRLQPKDAENTKVLRGEVLVKRPALLRVNVVDDKGKSVVSLFADDKTLHNYDFATRTERVFPPLPLSGARRSAGPEGTPGPFRDWVPEPNAWGLAGPPVRQLARRFDVRLAKEDRYYAYIELRPMAPEDRKLFWRARVVLDRNGPWLRQLWFELPDGGEDLWDYERPDTRPEPPLTRELILKGLKNLPPGWRRLDARKKDQPPAPSK
jgi:hypothetical protein